MMKRAFPAALMAVMLLAGCSTTTKYTVETRPDPKTGQTAMLQSVESKPPQNDSFVVVVYHGAGLPPSVYPDVDSAALVDVTAGAGKSALQVVERALKPKPEP
jgi:hypothetical protein